MNIKENLKISEKPLDKVVHGVILPRLNTYDDFRTDANLFNMTILLQKNIIKHKSVLVMFNCIVSMAIHYAISENRDIPTKVLISAQQVILEY